MAGPRSEDQGDWRRRISGASAMTYPRTHIDKDSSGIHGRCHGRVRVGGATSTISD